MLFILNKIFFNNFIVTPHAFTSLRLQSSSLPLPRSLDDEITDFECESENTPDVDELTDMGNNTPKGIRDVSDKEIEKVEDTAAKLLEKLRMSKLKVIFRMRKLKNIEVELIEQLQRLLVILKKPMM